MSDTVLARPLALERAADRAIHAAGLACGGAGAIAVVALAVLRRPEAVPAVAVYAAGLVAMLAASAAYHLARGSRHRERLRRIDHAAIFVMIAGTYTPFTVHALAGAWAAGMTAALWTAALLGAGSKLLLGRRFERFSVPAYLTLGWIVLLPADRLLGALDAATVWLLLGGGALYTLGAGVYLLRRMPYQTAVWHGMVLLAAACHYAAVLHGVVLTAAPLAGL